ncbi:MAG: hypothetical protein HOV81_01730 [Kofleriaceae bacterium]|nr:hypothetical protein [Kofleriaceae bacterium]
MSSEAQILIRLSDLLAQRGAPVDRVLDAIQRAGVESFFIAVSAFSDRILLLMPSRPGVIQALVPAYSGPELPADALLRAVIDGTQISAGVTITDNRGQRDIVGELVPAAVRDRWLSTVQHMLDLAPSSIMNFTRYLTASAASIAIEYPERAGEIEERFVKGVDELAQRVGVSSAQRALWSTLYPLARTNVALSIATECDARGPRPVLDILYGAATWDRAIDVTNAVLGKTSVAARETAAKLGMIAGAMEIDEPRGLEIVLGAGEHPDVLVWLAPR